MPKLVADGNQPVVFDYLINDKVYGEYITTSSHDFKSVLDKIVNMLGGFEYFYDVDDEVMEEISESNGWEFLEDGRIA